MRRGQLRNEDPKKRAFDWETFQCMNERLIRIEFKKSENKRSLMAFMLIDPEQAYELAQAILRDYDSITQGEGLTK